MEHVLFIEKKFVGCEAGAGGMVEGRQGERRGGEGKDKEKGEVCVCVFCVVCTHPELGLAWSVSSTVPETMKIP